MNGRNPRIILYALICFTVILVVVILLCFGITNRTLEISGVHRLLETFNSLEEDVHILKEHISTLETSKDEKSPVSVPSDSILESDIHTFLWNKKIVYDGDSIAESRESNGGGYPALIAEATGCTYENFAKGGARLCSNDERHSVVDNLINLPTNGDLYCFEGGINDFWNNTPLGEFDSSDYSGEYDTRTIYGALETIFTHCLNTYPGKPVCFVIPHKIQNTATSQNANGDTFEDYANAMIAVCQKYSIPYYDAFHESGLNGWNQTQNNLFLSGNSENNGDGIHPNSEGYRRYYVPQLLDLFEKIIPKEKNNNL